MAYILILFGAVARIIPHVPNFAPITAIALFSAVYLNKKAALPITIAAMILSDFVIGFDSPLTRLTVYGSFALITLLGFWLRKHKSATAIFGSSLAGSLIFYLITNFAFFYPKSMYPHDLAGIVASYINALPFLRWTMLGDLFYVGVFFGAYELAGAWHRRALLKKKSA